MSSQIYGGVTARDSPAVGYTPQWTRHTGCDLRRKLAAQSSLRLQKKRDSMSPEPTGRVVPTSGGADLILTRTFRASIDDVWKSVTDPDARRAGSDAGKAMQAREST